MLKAKAWPRGCVQVYTGDGKGKTTAAFGLALRAAGYGLRTFIGQFMKGTDYGELYGAQQLGGLITVEQFGSRTCLEYSATPDPANVADAQRGLARCREVMLSGEYAIVVLDEACVALHFKLLTVDELLSVVLARPLGLELVITGRYAPQELLDRADLITVMREVKHYYSVLKLPARDGIER